MTRAIGMTAFFAGAIALVAMLAVDILAIRQVPAIWFGGLAMILTGVMWTVPALHLRSGRNANG